MADDRYAVTFPTLWIVPDWVEAHCVIMNSYGAYVPFTHYDWQLYCTANHYRVKENAETQDANGNMIRSAAFHNRRSAIMAPQKTGKGPWSATMLAAEGAGPVLFAGWAQGGEQYVCEDNGCDCGWVYTYSPGEAMGRGWPKPKIQMMATSEDQVDNVFDALKEMIENGPLGHVIAVREGFVRLRNGGRLDKVTSSANSRLGQPITFALADETGLYTKSNKLITTVGHIRRGLAGMSGRSIDTTNCYDPAEQSDAQLTFEARVQDIFKFYEKPPTHWSWRNKDERRRLIRHNYAGSKHIDIESILAEAAELDGRDPTQAERFFGNRIVAGAGAWLEDEMWEKIVRPTPEEILAVMHHG